MLRLDGDASRVLVNGLLIEAFQEIDTATVSAQAALFEFDRARYLGVRRADASGRIEPGGSVGTEAGYARTSFPERQVELTPARRPYFSYVEPWTIPPWTLNVIAPPPDFLAAELTAEFLDGSGELRFRPAQDGGRLFYFALAQGSGERIGFETRAVFVRDATAAQRETARADRIRASNWRNLWAAAAGPLGTAGEILGAAAAIKALFG